MNKTSDWIKAFFITYGLFCVVLTTTKTQLGGYLSMLLITLFACLAGKILFFIINSINK